MNRLKGTLRSMLIFSLFFISISSNGQDWKFINGTADGDMHYYNTGKAIRDGNIIKGWVKSSISANKLKEYRKSKIKLYKKLGVPTNGFGDYTYTLTQEVSNNSNI